MQVYKTVINPPKPIDQLTFLVGNSTCFGHSEQIPHCSVVFLVTLKRLQTLHCDSIYICVQLHTRCSISGFSIGGILFYYVCFFQDLQFEIDTERENFLALTATGRKILKQMDDGSSGGASLEDAALIQRKLDTMNQRWNHLKAKSIAIR